MKTLSIDIGLTNTGLALFEEQELLWAKTLVCLKQNKLAEQSDYLIELILSEDNLQNIIYEEPQVFNNKFVEHELWKICGLLETLAIRFNKNIYNYNPSTIKKQITGNGKAKKKEIRTKVLERLGKDSFENKITHHEIDAIAIGLTHFLLQALK